MKTQRSSGAAVGSLDSQSVLEKMSRYGLYLSEFYRDDINTCLVGVNWREIRSRFIPSPATPLTGFSRTIPTSCWEYFCSARQKWLFPYQQKPFSQLITIFIQWAYNTVIINDINIFLKISTMIHTWKLVAVVAGLLLSNIDLSLAFRLLFCSGFSPLSASAACSDSAFSAKNDDWIS